MAWTYPRVGVAATSSALIYGSAIKMIPPAARTLTGTGCVELPLHQVPVLAHRRNVMNRIGLFIAVLALVSPAAYAQQSQQPQRPQQDPTYEMMRRQAQMSDRQDRERQNDLARGNYKQWTNESMAQLSKLRAQLAEAWQSMGLSPQGAKLVADAYDPRLITDIHRSSVRGKSNQEIAQMMQDALKDKQYLQADQLLLDYQQRQLELDAAKTDGDTH